MQITEKVYAIIDMAIVVAVLAVDVGADLVVTWSLGADVIVCECAVRLSNSL